MYTIKEGRLLKMTCVAEGKVIQNYNLQKTIHPSISYPYSLLKMFHLGSVYVGFGKVTALDMSAMLWYVSLLYTKDHLQMRVSHKFIAFCHVYTVFYDR